MDWVLERSLNSLGILAAVLISSVVVGLVLVGVTAATQRIRLEKASRFLVLVITYMTLLFVVLFVCFTFGRPGLSSAAFAACLVAVVVVASVLIATWPILKNLAKEEKVALWIGVPCVLGDVLLYFLPVGENPFIESLRATLAIYSLACLIEVFLLHVIKKKES